MKATSAVLVSGSALVSASVAVVVTMATDSANGHAPAAPATLVASSSSAPELALLTSDVGCNPLGQPSHYETNPGGHSAAVGPCEAAIIQRSGTKGTHQGNLPGALS